jgi:hypothetical protein
VVHAHDVHGSVTRWSRDDNLLATSFDVSRSFFDAGEDSSRLAYNFGSDRSPSNLFWVSLGKELDFGAVHDKAVSFDLDLARVLSMNRVILELVGSVVDREERVVDSDDRGIWVFQRRATNKSSNATESVDSKLNWHDDCC